MTELDIQHLPDWKAYKAELESIVEGDGDPEGYLKYRIGRIDVLINNAEEENNK